MISSSEALHRLREGNQRFVSGGRNIDGVFNYSRRDELVFGQEPFAIILGCCDSRVSPEIVFDQWLGDLFVLRVAGNIAAPSQIGSIEIAIAQFKPHLVVVMGHTQCAAVCATIEEIQCPAGEQSQNINSILDRIRPSAELFMNTDLWQQKNALIYQVVRANIEASVGQLRHGSKMLEQLIECGELCVVGAEYSIETGVVEFI